MQEEPSESVAMTRFALTLLPVLFLAPACAMVDADFLVDGGDTGAVTGAGAVDEDQSVPTTLLECDLPLPCDLPFEGMTLEADGAAATYSDNDRCVFQAMAGDGPALVQTAASFSAAVAYLDYAIVEPGVALRQASGVSDASGRWQKGVFRCELQPAAFFLACAEAPSGPCLDPEMWVRSCAPLDILVCPG